MKPDVYAEIKVKIKKIFHLHKGRYGSRRITLALRNIGIMINHKKVRRLMLELNLESKVRLKRYNSYKGQEGKSVDNLLQRDFTASKPNQKWVTDVTDFNIKGQKVYLSPLLDLFSGNVVALRIAKSAHLSLVKGMFEDTISKLKMVSSLYCIAIKDGNTEYRRYKKCYRTQV